MKNSILLLAIKCSVIVYFAACTGIESYTTAVSATPIVTKGEWKVEHCTDAAHGETNLLEGYAFSFQPQGVIKATKNGQEISGNWMEDNISGKLVISLDTKDPELKKLNNYWEVSSISKEELVFHNIENNSNCRLQITSL